MATKKRSPRRRGTSQKSVLIGCRVQKPFLKDLDTYRKPLKLSRPAAFVKLATEHLAGLKEPAEKMWVGAVEQMFPVPGGVKGGEEVHGGLASLCTRQTCYPNSQLFRFRSSSVRSQRQRLFSTPGLRRPLVAREVAIREAQSRDRATEAIVIGAL